mmetsp:Transcript_27134/g.58083  ORF Transcript_27134/g.58083 Transcript_27134/m.58083 type:complete len:105 (-) Transcript_27134:183-497(-)
MFRKRLECITAIIAIAATAKTTLVIVESVMMVTLVLVEKKVGMAHLCRNKCKRYCSMHSVFVVVFRSLRMRILDSGRSNRQTEGTAAHKIFGVSTSGTFCGNWP